MMCKVGVDKKVKKKFLLWEYTQTKTVMRRTRLVGKFDIELKEDAFVVTLNIGFRPKSLTSGIQRIIKAMEGFWNSGNGFGRFYFHRTDCVRQDDCDCSNGCCRFPVRVVAKQGGDHFVQLHQVGALKYHFLNALGSEAVRDNTANFYLPGKAYVFAHEAGHYLGLPDEYAAKAGGTVQLSGAEFPEVDRDSIMETFGAKAFERHLKFIKEWVGNNYGKGEFKVCEMK
jgi:hypothetical protein